MHILISISPKYSVLQVVGFIKGKIAIWVARRYGRKRNFTMKSGLAHAYEAIERIAAVELFPESYEAKDNVYPTLKQWQGYHNTALYIIKK